MSSLIRLQAYFTAGQSKLKQNQVYSRCVFIYCLVCAYIYLFSLIIIMWVYAFVLQKSIIVIASHVLMEANV